MMNFARTDGKDTISLIKIEKAKRCKLTDKICNLFKNKSGEANPSKGGDENGEGSRDIYIKQ